MIRDVPFRTEPEQRAAAADVAAHLRNGGIIAYPTETVYGFGSALRPAALEKLARLKGRSDDKPFLILVRDAELPGVEWTPAARALASEYWPGPLTLVLRTRPGAFAHRVTGANHTVAVRATSHPGVRLLLEALGEPLTSTSANLPGQPPATTADQARTVLLNCPADADVWLLDGGPLPASPPSTIIDGTVQPPRLLRRGAIEIAQLAENADGIQRR
jgi:L-threonylcarbamoyladenylate synthase